MLDYLPSGEIIDVGHVDRRRLRTALRLFDSAPPLVLRQPYARSTSPFTRSINPTIRSLPNGVCSSMYFWISASIHFLRATTPPAYTPESG